MLERVRHRLVMLALVLSAATPMGCGAPEDVGVTRSGIVTMAPHLTETVFALGLGDRVVARGDFCDYPPEAAALPKAGGYLDPDYEKLTMLSPALLIVGGNHQELTDFAKMKRIDVLNVHMDSFATIDAGIAKLGTALKCEAEADALRKRIRDELDAVRAAVKPFPRVKVLIISMRNDHSLNTLYTVGGESFVSEVVACAGGDNVYGDSEIPYLEASKETVVVREPDVIIEIHAGENLSAEEQARYVADWNQMPSLPAVRNGRVYLIMESHALRPGPRVAEIARRVARCLHPEAGIPSS
ncbi:MAG: ABC transporter substrate-binding protein [Nitrospiraceae bacterium]|nr:ABC transporter substrate-binding protein [Nitrospiraceae bacterium]